MQASDDSKSDLTSSKLPTQSLVEMKILGDSKSAQNSQHIGVCQLNIKEPGVKCAEKHENAESWTNEQSTYTTGVIHT